MPHNALDALRAALDAVLVGQALAKRGCLLALLARQHVYLEGPPGCGKSALATGLAAVSGARLAILAVHRETRAADLLGPSILVRRASAGGERIHLARGRPPLRDVALLLLDDLSRAPGEALLPLLRALSERRLDGEPLALECAIATAPTAPPGATAEPLEVATLDRFGVQIRMGGLLATAQFSEAKRLLDAPPPRFQAPAIDTSMRHRLQRRAAMLPIPAAVREALVSLTLRLGRLEVEGRSVLLSDRSLSSCAPALLRAHALLRGAESVAYEDLAAIRFMLGRRAPEALLALAEALVEEAARGAKLPPTSVPSAALGAGAGETRPGDRAVAGPVAEPAETLLAPAAAPGRASGVQVAALLRAFDGRLEPGRVDRGADPGGSPRRQARLVRLDELEDADEIEALLFVDGILPGAPRVLRRERRRAAGALALLRDVSASMEGALGRAASQVVSGIVRAGAKRRMRIGYLEFHHAAEAFEAGGSFFHRRYGRLLALAGRERAEGRTSFEAPLRVALAAFGSGRAGDRHVVLITDGLPVVGDPWVTRERALARRLGVRVHTVFMGSGEPPAVLERLTAETGGGAFVLDGALAGELRVRERGAA